VLLTFVKKTINFGRIIFTNHNKKLCFLIAAVFLVAAVVDIPGAPPLAEIN
jgi:hypothetical protein